MNQNKNCIVREWDIWTSREPEQGPSRLLVSQHGTVVQDIRSLKSTDSNAINSRLTYSDSHIISL